MKQLLFFFCFIFALTTSYAQTELWGLTEAGGLDNAGTIFKTDINGQNLVTEYNFNQIDGSGSGPSSQLLQIVDGRYFGMTPNGGKYNFGVLYQYDPSTNIYTKKFEFDGSINGKSPQGALMQALDGKLYGMTNLGGANNMGVLFEYDPNSDVYTKLLDFNGANGNGPLGNLMQAQDGMLYGLANSGGSLGGGILFQFDPVSHIYTLRYDFAPLANGYSPSGTLIQALDGKLYGVASGGGTSSDGVIFQFDLTTNTYTKKYDFTGSGTGSRPGGALLRASNDMMYGLTYFGGATDKGVLFEYDYNTNTFSKKLDLTIANGANPWGTLIQATNGLLYGVTETGGSNNAGTMFQYDISLNSYTKKFDFGGTNGGKLLGPIMQGSNGKLYGTTFYYNINSSGLLFEYDIVSGSYSKKVDFGASAAGRAPSALLKAKNGKLYGITLTGGLNNKGTIFYYDPILQTKTKVYDFDSINGLQDLNTTRVSLLEALDGTFYGTFSDGGLYGEGILYQFNPVTLIYTKKYDFLNNGNGHHPIGKLVQTADSMIYGLVSVGLSGYGALYKFNPNTNVYTKKFDFNIPSNGNGPQEIVQLNDSIFYGITLSGGTSSGGTIFQYNFLKNTYLKKYNFINNSFASAHGPNTFMKCSDGNFYGTYTGSPPYLGGVFKYNPITNNVTYIYTFVNVVNGYRTSINLMETTAGKLYGLMHSGGLYDKGVMFELDPATNSYSKIIDFMGPNGNRPSSLIELGDTIVTKPITTTICAGNKINVPFAMVGNFQAGNNFNVQLSNASGSFSSPLVLGSFNTPLIGSVNVLVPLGTPPGNGYRVRVVSTNPVMIGNDNGTNITINAFISPTLTVSNGAICPGKTFTMTPSGCVSYTYSSGTATVAPTYDSTFTIIGADVYGCLDTVSCFVHVNPTPTITTSSSPAGVCPGNTATLTANGAITYTWNPGVLIGSSVVVTPTVTTNYFVFGTDGNGCTSNFNLNLNVSGSNFSYVINPTPICPGATATITASGLNTYTWHPGAIAGNSITAIAGASTIYTVQGSFAAGCIATETINFAAATVSISSSSSSICVGNSVYLSGSGMSTYTWNPGFLNGNTAYVTPTVNTTYTLTGSTGSCSSTNTILITVTPTVTLLVSNGSICSGQSFTINPSGASVYSYSGGSAIVTPTASTTYTVTGSLGGSCIDTKTLSITVNPLPTLTVAGINTVCLGTSSGIIANGATTYTWNTGQTTSSISVNPTSTTIYSVTGTDMNGCINSETISVTVDNTCADVWPGDANSDGTADNLDVLELGLHYTQTGAPRANVSNSWQSYFANNWGGTITNGKNMNHSDCNGDGIINDNDTLSIYNNYNLTHTFKPVQTNTLNPQLSIVPDQPMVVKGMWGTASIYLGDATGPINNINGIAYTIDFDNTLIEPNSIYIEYQNSFMDASQNLYFRKLDFANSKLFTASTHTVSNNVSGFGKIATLYYQISSTLTTDQTLTLGVSQVNQSNATGLITPLTSGTGTLMAIGASVGIKENLVSGNVLVSPNPTNGLLNISFNTIPQNAKIEMYNTVGALVLAETMNNKNNTINVGELSSGMYFIKVLEENKVVVVKKVVKE